MKSKRRSSGNAINILGVLFLAFGVLLLILSIYATSQTFAFIGLGLTFWGALFILIKTTRHVESSLLETITAPEYANLDRIITNLNLRREAFCIPSISTDSYLPEHLRSLKDTVIFIPAENAKGIASIEELVKGKFQIENPQGILITPPGLGILNKQEQKHKIEIAKTPLSEIAEKLQPLLEDLNIAKNIAITLKGNDATIQITESLYGDLYEQKHALRSINILGCPLVSAAVCALAKSSGKPVTLQRVEIQTKIPSITAEIKILEA